MIREDEMAKFLTDKKMQGYQLLLSNIMKKRYVYRKLVLLRKCVCFEETMQRSAKSMMLLEG